jgi:hypothetical protein
VSADPPRAPDGYTRFLLRGADVVALSACADAVRQAFDRRTLYIYAEHHPKRRVLHGRLPVYAVPLPDGRTRIVVRHATHGGLFAALTGDRFIKPTRAPHELATSLRLAQAHVATPQIVAYATYPAGPLLNRADVATRELVGGRDLVALMRDPLDEAPKHAVLGAVGALLRAMAHAGARHPDLNLKNILVVTAPAPDPACAYVLDVDRIVFGAADDPRVADANLRRLTRSARKLRDAQGVRITENDLAQLTELAGVTAA